MPKQNTHLAIFFMVLAAVSFATMGALVKASTGHLPFLVAVLFRNVISVIPLIIYFRVKGLSFRVNNRKLMFARSTFGFSAMFLYFLAIEYLPLSLAVVLNSSSPVFVVIMSGLILRERDVGKLIPLVVLALVGVAWLVFGQQSPEAGAKPFSIGIALLGLLSAVLAAAAYVAVRKLSATEPSARIVLHFGLWSSFYSVVALVIAVVAGYEKLEPAVIWDVISTPKSLLMLIGVGLAGLGGQMFMTAAYARERASIVSGFSYLNPVFAYFIGLLVFGEPLTVSGIGGGLLVLGASLGLTIMAEHNSTVPKPSP